MARRDGKARMPWSVKGVSAEARELAKSATAREGDTMGQWLSDVIRRVGAAQAAGRPVGVAHHRRSVPAVGAPGPGGRSATGGTVPAAAPRPAAGPADSVDEEVLATLIAERVERSETRLVGLLHSLEDIVGRLADRLDHLERTLDDADRGPARSLPPR
ncbi:hypothetical protein GCM10017083_01550 [Thalassobaculum fulvum]|uniref:Uncharacterized protein n=1 Tax=Thalassobaculum fulvum TaxID=1633335 RepID=A0A918XNG9_9PROT|nr:hypothetical protein [Thalassobaculum fulvum]GHD39566.1 hypothetical protein GCM10017083_01550 [Thalassobaculum fulvum]